MKINIKIFLIVLGFGLISTNSLFAQLGELRWMRIGELYQYFSEQGTDFEDGRSSRTYVTPSDGMIWPGDYGEIQQTNCAHGFWLGARNVYHPVEDKTYNVRVIGRGPRNHTGWQYELFPVEHKMIARLKRPSVTINYNDANDLSDWEDIDEEDEDLPCDRMIVTKFNTIIGVSVTKKILAWGDPDNDDFFIYDYTIKNTGIYDEKGSVYEQEIEDLWIASLFRYAFSGESVSGYDQGWGLWETTWGRNTIYHCIGENSSDPGFDLRATYAWYGPLSARGLWDYGCPNDQADPTDNIIDEHMAAAKYAGAVTLHADTAPGDTTDNLSQPATTIFLDSDNDVFQAVSAYNEPVMLDRYTFMSSGHPANSMWGDMDANGFTFVDEYIPGLLGGVNQFLGYGPYTLQPGDSIRIVIAEGVKGLSREKNREVTKNWLMHYTGEGTPTLTLPDGNTTTVPEDYIKAWVLTCEDSIINTLKQAKWVFDQNYNIPQAPPPPTYFSVTGGGDRINLEWATNAESFTNVDGYSFDGYEIGRAINNINNTETKYTKIFECDVSGTISAWSDTNVVGNNYYYYYIVTKATNNAGNTIRSSKFFTLTNISGEGAQLVRPAGTNLGQIRVVPNPFVISKDDEVHQFPLDDEIRFYEIPGYCKIKVFTERGDLVWEYDHKDSSGKTNWVSLTLSGQTITSGIYIAYFEVTQDPPQDGDVVYDYKKGDHTYRKFMVIR